MTMTEWIAIISLALLYGTAIIGFFIKLQMDLKEIQLKMEADKKELELKMLNNYEAFKAHEEWGQCEKIKIDNRIQEEKERLDNRIDKLLEENKLDHKIISIKIDKLLESLNLFKIQIIEKISDL